MISNMDIHHLKVMKMAAAMAVLSSKPSHFTAREYTEKLCNDYQRSQMMWRERYEASQLELLHTKQELLVSKVDQIEPQDDTESDALFLTPPSSGREQCQQNCDLSQTERFERHTAFLKSIIGLKSAKKCISSPELYEVVQPTVTHSLEIVHKTVKNSDQTISFQHLEQSVESITQIIDAANRKISQPIMKGVKDIINAAIEIYTLWKTTIRSQQRKNINNLSLDSYGQNSLWK
ncbi:hypothetical protein ScPMuIL_012957 [Solemya velum]